MKNTFHLLETTDNNHNNIVLACILLLWHDSLQRSFLTIIINSSSDAYDGMLVSADTRLWGKAAGQWHCVARNYPLSHLFRFNSPISPVFCSHHWWDKSIFYQYSKYRGENVYYCNVFILLYFTVTFYSNTCGLIGIAILLNCLCLKISRERKFTKPPKFLTRTFSGFLGKLLCLGNYTHQVYFTRIQCSLCSYPL